MPALPARSAALALAALGLGGVAPTAAHAADADRTPRPAVPPQDAGHSALPAGPTAVVQGIAAGVGGIGDGLTGLGGIKANPLSGTGVDPLTNGVGTQIADFKPISTTDLTVPVSNLTLGDL